MKHCSIEGHRSSTRSRDILPSIPILRFYQKKETITLIAANGLAQGVPNNMFPKGSCVNLLLVYGTDTLLSLLHAGNRGENLWEAFLKLK